MTYIIIAAACLLLGFVFGFLSVALLSCNKDNEEELRQDLFLEQKRNLDLIKKVKKLEEQNQEMQESFLALLNQGRYEDTSNTL